MGHGTRTADRQVVWRHAGQPSAVQHVPTCNMPQTTPQAWMPQAAARGVHGQIATQQLHSSNKAASSLSHPSAPPHPSSELHSKCRSPP